MYWYNCIRPHGAFDITKLETPIKMFYARMPQREMLIDPSLLLKGWNDFVIKQTPPTPLTHI
jgi:hypothetical protein